MRTIARTIAWITAILLAIIVTYIVGVNDFIFIVVTIGALFYYSFLKKAEPGWKKNSWIFVQWKKDSQSIENAITFSVMLLVSIAVLEVSLRNLPMFADLKNYSEVNGAGYSSPYERKQDKDGLFQMYAPDSSYIIQRKEFTRRVHANSLGLNDKERHLKKDSLIRIAAMGNSFTEGIGAIGDSSYPEILQTLLPHTEVMRCGLSGSDFIYSYRLLQKKIINYHPDLITIVLNSSDINYIMAYGGFERFTNNTSRAPWWEPLFANSFIVRSVVLRLLHRDFLFLTKEEKAKEKEKAIGILKAAVDSVQVFCQKKNIRCILIFPPGESEIRDGKMACDPILCYAQDKGYEVIDLLAYFLAHGVNCRNCSAYFWRLDWHSNNKGYALWAKAQQEKIQFR